MEYTTLVILVPVGQRRETPKLHNLMAAPPDDLPSARRAIHLMAPRRLGSPCKLDSPRMFESHRRHPTMDCRLSLPFYTAEPLRPITQVARYAVEGLLILHEAAGYNTEEWVSGMAEPLDAAALAMLRNMAQVCSSAAAECGAQTGTS